MITVCKINVGENDKNKEEVKDSKECLTESKGSSRSVIGKLNIISEIL